MKHMKGKFALWLGIGTMVWGLMFVLPVFGYMEMEVFTWGVLTVLLGALIAFVRNRWIASLLLAGVVAMQYLPIVHWFDYHGRSIADSTPGSSFEAHWAFSGPHLLIAVASLTLILLQNLPMQKKV